MKDKLGYECSLCGQPAFYLNKKPGLVKGKRQCKADNAYVEPWAEKPQSGAPIKCQFCLKDPKTGGKLKLEKLKLYNNFGSPACAPK